MGLFGKKGSHSHAGMLPKATRIRRLQLEMLERREQVSSSILGLLGAAMLGSALGETSKQIAAEERPARKRPRWDAWMDASERRSLHSLLSPSRFSLSDDSQSGSPGQGASLSHSVNRDETGAFGTQTHASPPFSAFGSSTIDALASVAPYSSGSAPAGGTASAPSGGGSAAFSPSGASLTLSDDPPSASAGGGAPAADRTASPETQSDSFSPPGSIPARDGQRDTRAPLLDGQPALTISDGDVVSSQPSIVGGSLAAESDGLIAAPSDGSVISPAGGWFSMVAGRQSELLGNAINGAYHADGKFLVASLASRPDHGSLALERDGSFVYRPEDGFLGVDAFTCTVATLDGRESQLAGVVLHVMPDVAADGELVQSPLVASSPWASLVAADAVADAADGSEILRASQIDVAPTVMFTPPLAGNFVSAFSWQFEIDSLSSVVDDGREGAGLVNVSREIVSREDASGNWSYTDFTHSTYSFESNGDRYFGESTSQIQAFAVAGGRGE